MASATPDALVAKIAALPAERIAEVEDFIDFLQDREASRALTRAATATSASSFAAVWSNPEDDVYDEL
jgi:hypothetical protein